MASLAYQSLVCAFLVTLVVALAPLLGDLVPAAAPWIANIITVIALFIGAAGAWDTAQAFRRPVTTQHIGP